MTDGKKGKRAIFEYIPRWAAVTLALTVVLLILLVLCRSIPALADFLNGTVALAVRFILSTLTLALPFSLFECILLLALPTLVYLIVLAVRCEGAAARIRGVSALLATVGILLSSFVLTLGVGYHTTPLARRIGLDEDEAVTRDELYRTTLTVRDKVNALAFEVELQGGESRMERSFLTLSRDLTEAYGVIAERYSMEIGYFSRVKPVRYSGIMADMGITGIYSYFTGEANVNTAYPDYCLPFTSAHEMAHQRGFSRENEANFMAFLVCEASEDSYIQYSGYLNLYEYLRNALYRTDREAYYEIEAGLSEVARADIAAANAVSLAHRDSPLRTLMDKINDGYLKANGTEGVVSYGYVVRLAVAYFG